MKYDVGIIGSGPAGLSAAIYAKRANLSAVVIEKEYEGTGQIAESGQVDNYPGFPGISGYDLGENFREHAVKLGVSFMEQEVTEIKKEASSDFELVFGSWCWVLFYLCMGYFFQTDRGKNKNASFGSGR